MVRPEPILLEPVFMPRIWGARSLAPLFPDQRDLREPLGEAWLTAHEARVASGLFAGETLGAAWREMRAEWRGARLAQAPVFPLLAKFLFPTAKMSIQVHPNDDFAAKHECGSSGKTEMWYAIAAKSGAGLLLGLKAGTTPETLRAALERNSLEQFLERWDVRQGDAFFVPAGTPHTLGPGMILCEVQQYCDLTYRLYDYGRVDSGGNPRPLQMEKALRAIHFGPSACGRTTPAEVTQGALRKKYLAACPYFALEEWRFDAPVEAGTRAAQFELLIVLEGEGELESRAGTCRYGRAQAWLLPATLGAYRLMPQHETSLLRAYVPDMKSLPGELRDQGLSAAAISRLVFE
jgi:mannose-6-phosphate isomerase